MKIHVPAKISTCESIRLFFKRQLSCLLSCCGDLSAKDKLYRLLEQGEERIEKEFDVIKHIKSFRNLMILMKESNMLDDRLKLRIANLGANVIDLDNDEDVHDGLDDSYDDATSPIAGNPETTV